MGLRAVAALMFVGLVACLGGAVELVRFESTGTFADGVYWLEDSNLNQHAVWEFRDVPQGIVTLELDAFVDLACKKVRDNRVYVRIFYRLPPDGPWEIADLALRPERGKRGHLVPARGRVAFVWTQGGRMEVRLVRTYACDPHVGVEAESLRFVEEGEATPPPPAPPPPTPSPPSPTPVVPPKPAPPQTPSHCYDIPGAICYPDGASLKAAYGIEVPDVPIEERTLLPETSSPGDAYVLGPGHYWGVLGDVLDPHGATDTQDWYKIELSPGKAAVVYIQHLGLLEYQAYIYDVCGHPQREPLGEAQYCLLPYTEDVHTYLLRVFRESGVGEYLISVFFVDLCPRNRAPSDAVGQGSG